MTQTSKKTFANSVFFQQVCEFINEEKDVVFSLRGSSMSPFLKEGDLITIKPIESTTLKLGHIVLAHFKTDYVLHRIIRLDNDHVYLAGDANLVQIEKIERTKVIGLLCDAKRGNKNITLYTFPTLYSAWFWYYARPCRRIWAKLFRKK